MCVSFISIRVDAFILKCVNFFFTRCIRTCICFMDNCVCVFIVVCLSDY